MRTQKYIVWANVGFLVLKEVVHIVTTILKG